MSTTNKTDKYLEDINSEELKDYYLAFLSRQLSILGRREVHNGKAQFGIFGDGKELAQIAYAKNFKKGDWRSGYYRDQTFMLYLDLLKPEEFFAMIYGETNIEHNPSTGGRNFNNHFNSSNVNENGEIRDLMAQYNTASDISSTAGQMPRLMGLAQASKIVRKNPELKNYLNNNVYGNEVAFGSIGDASTSEGMFFETINAAGVLQIPLSICVYDDGYGISVAKKLQTTKESISDVLSGFIKEENTNGIYIYKCKGWNYVEMLSTFAEGIKKCREEQVPVLFHVEEVTQPLGHSTSGSHERYKTKERLNWEAKFDCLVQFRKYILENNIADDKTLGNIEKVASKRAKQARDNAWNNYSKSFTNDIHELGQIVEKFTINKACKANFDNDFAILNDKIFPTRRNLYDLAKNMSLYSHDIKELESEREIINNWIEEYHTRTNKLYNCNLLREGNDSSIKVKPLAPTYENDSQIVNGCQILSDNFHKLFAKHHTLVTFGEDTGFMGDVNQGMKGMQNAFGEHRVADTGIRETTIIGQGVGLALRGFRPIAEIQYLDYLMYALPTLSDDVASLQYRTMGKQVCPLIVRTRGHQLQGIWHAGSPMQMLLGSLRGFVLCVPRNMTQAAGMYNTLLESNDPALVIEPLKAYNEKEQLPANIGEYKIPIGVPEFLRKGNDITLVTYGWNVNNAIAAAEIIENYKSISVEVIDIQTLMPFDINHLITNSVKKTNKLVLLDEDVPGGASAYMMQKILQEQKAFNYLDCEPICISAAEHRPAYGVDGEHFTKPNVYKIVDTIYNMMNSVDQSKYKKM